MATRSKTETPLSTFGDNAVLVSWTGLLNGDDGVPVELPGASLRSIQFTGTFGTGGTILLEGSNDGSNYVTLTDPQGNAISKTSAGLEASEEVTRYVRPRVSAGDGSTSLTATLLLIRR